MQQLPTSNSFLKRLKTQHNTKKYSQGFLYDYKSKSKTPSSKLSGTSSTVKNILTRIQNGKKKCAYERIERIILQDKEDYVLNCINHPHKQATFEDKNTMKSAFCDECAIQMVKKDYRLMKMSERSLRMRAIYEQELDKIIESEEKAHVYITEFFKAQYQEINYKFLKAKTIEQDQKIELVRFYQPHKDSLQIRQQLKPIIGCLKSKIFQIYTQKEVNKQKHEHQNFPHNISKSPYSSKQSHSPYSVKGGLTFRKNSTAKRCGEEKENSNPNRLTEFNQQLESLQKNSIMILKTQRQSSSCLYENENQQINTHTQVSKWKKKKRVDSLQLSIKLQHSQ